MVKNTKDAIRMLPITDKLKHDLIAKFDSLDIGARHDLIVTVWEAYDTIVEDKIDEKFYEKFEKLADGEREASDFYKEAKDEVEKEMAVEAEVVVREDELSDVRNKLKTIIAAD